MKQILIVLGVLALIAGLSVYVMHTTTSREEVTTTNTYAVEHVGIRFEYPKVYTLTSRHEFYEGQESHILTILNASTTVPDMSEGPIAMSVIEIPVATSTNLETWIREHSISNFALSPDKTFASTTVAGEPALAYRHSGLYEFDAVAVKHNAKIYVLSTSWMNQNDAIRQDFKDLLASVTFIQ